jgi:hypothetical protein
MRNVIKTKPVYRTQILGYVACAAGCLYMAWVIADTLTSLASGFP